MVANLDLQNEVGSDRFTRFFGGHLDAVEGASFPSWATPYALSIYGQEYTSNCPFGTGNGYGDGRALSFGEVLIPHGEDGAATRWELNFKGSGKTPFCRSGDGRAVLRSSVREFLASEALFHLNVSTTRALALVVSDTETARRVW
jgi:uncharacterized protein YdiU (UPF0061 family)